MLLLYVWRPGDDAAPDAAARFDAVVAAEQNACEGWTGLPVESRSRSAGGGFVGLIGPDLGIEGHTGWYDDDGRGFAWLGVCEDFLGQPAEETSRAIGALDADPATVVGWTGRFALSRWDTRAGRLELMTAATESPSLWWANGPGGWAAGSRPGVVRRLAGVEARLDLNQ